MASPPYSSVEALAHLERLIVQYYPTLIGRFSFGLETEDEIHTYPWVVWDVNGSDERAPNDRRRPVKGQSDPQSFDCDWVQFTARCYGGPAPNNPAPSEREPRRAEQAASENLMLIVRWALRRMGAGVHQVGAWRTVTTEGPEDAGTPIDLDFSLILRCVAPPRPIVAPTSAPIEEIDVENP